MASQKGFNLPQSPLPQNDLSGQSRQKPDIPLVWQNMHAFGKKMSLNDTVKFFQQNSDK